MGYGADLNTKTEPIEEDSLLGFDSENNNIVSGKHESVRFSIASLFSKLFSLSNIGFGTSVFSFIINGIERSSKLFVKGSTSGGSDLYTYNTVLTDSSDRPVAMFNNTGRMDLIDHSGMGGVTLISNYGEPVNGRTDGHYAFGGKNSEGNANTTAYILSSTSDITETSMDSTLQFAFMDGCDTSGGYSQPNRYMTLDAMALRVPSAKIQIINKTKTAWLDCFTSDDVSYADRKMNMSNIGTIDVAGVLYQRGSLQVLNKAGNAFLNWAYRDTSGSETRINLMNIGTISAKAIPIYANNAAAISGGLSAGSVYRTGADPDPLMIVH